MLIYNLFCLFCCFHSVIWLNFVRQFGWISFGNLAETVKKTPGKMFCQVHRCVANYVVEAHYVCSLFIFVAIGKGIAYTFAKSHISVVDRVEGHEVHLFHIGFAVFSQIGVISQDIYNFSHHIASGG